MKENGSEIKIAFLLLCHEDFPVLRKRLTNNYFSNNYSKVYIHYDATQTNENRALLSEFVSKSKKMHLVANSVKCKWGQFSLVEATLNLISTVLKDKLFKPDYLYLISTSCYPIKPFKSLQNFLFKYKGSEFIEANNIQNKKWVMEGDQTERYKYYYNFNYRTQNWLFEKSKQLQIKFNVQRKPPQKLNLHFGSQWFCITNDSAKLVLDKFKDKEIKSFFKYSWIPDEFAIQTIIGTYIRFDLVKNFSLTYYQFNSRGIPLTIYNDHKDFVKRLNFFFVRKVSPNTSLSEFCNVQNNIKNEDFSNIGQKPAAYKIFKLEKLDSTKGSKIGRRGDPWKDGMERNYKKFTVVTGPSAEYIKFINKHVRQTYSGPVFDYLFEQNECDIGAKDSYFGFSKNDKVRRDYDIPAFLYQVINCNSKEAIISIDLNNEQYIRELIRWSYECTVLIIDPFKGHKTKSLVSRLNSTITKEIATLDSDQITDLLEELNKDLDLYYWQRIINDSNANINFIEYDKSQIAKYYQNAIKKINLKNVYSKEKINLINKL